MEFSLALPMEFIIVLKLLITRIWALISSQRLVLFLPFIDCMPLRKWCQRK